LIGDLLSSVLPSAVTPSADLWEAWRDAAGEPTARHTVDLQLAGGTLSVWVDGARWAVELRTIAEPLLQRLREQTFGSAIERLRIHER